MKRESDKFGHLMKVRDSDGTASLYCCTLHGWFMNLYICICMHPMIGISSIGIFCFFLVKN